MRGPRTQESLKTQDIGLYKASGTRALLRRTRIQEPKMISDPDFYRELCFSIFSNGLVTSYFEEHLKLAVFVQPVSSVLFTSIRVQPVMHNNFMNILSFSEHISWYLSQQLLQDAMDYGSWRYPWLDRAFSFHLVIFIIIIGFDNK